MKAFDFTELKHLPSPNSDELCLVDCQYNFVDLILKEDLVTYLEKHDLIDEIRLGFRDDDGLFGSTTFVYPHSQKDLLQHLWCLPKVEVPNSGTYGTCLSMVDHWDRYTKQSLCEIIQYRIRLALKKYPVVVYGYGGCESDLIGWERIWRKWCIDTLLPPLTSNEVIFGPGHIGYSGCLILHRRGDLSWRYFINSIPKAHWKNWAPKHDYEAFSSI